MECILIVDDEPGIRLVLLGILKSAGYAVEAVESAEDALELLAQIEYSLLLVDLKMTGLDGLGLIEQARARYPDIATVILTGFPSVDTAIQALRGRVEDYLVKPAHPDAIRAAVRRALDQRSETTRRTAALSNIARQLNELLDDPRVNVQSASSTSVQRGPLLLDEPEHHAEWYGQPLVLTPTEFKLLFFLADNAGRVFSPQALVAVVQGYKSEPFEARELLKPHIYSLRAKLEPDPAKPRYLMNVRGVGYTLRLD